MSVRRARPIACSVMALFSIACHHDAAPSRIARGGDPAAPAPATAAPRDSVPPAVSAAPSSIASPPGAIAPRISLGEAGSDVLTWDLQVIGLPVATEDGFIVADLSHGAIARSLGLTLRWLRFGSAAGSTFTVLDEKEVSTLVDDELPVSAVGPRAIALAERTRRRVAEANQRVNAKPFHPVVVCATAMTERDAFCEEPQAIRCRTLSATLEGDTLAWRGEDGEGKRALGIAKKPMQITEGPKTPILSCVRSAYYDPSAKSLALKIEYACKGGGGDACTMDGPWRVVPLR